MTMDVRRPVVTGYQGPGEVDLIVIRATEVPGWGAG